MGWILFDAIGVFILWIFKGFKGSYKENLSQNENNILVTIIGFVVLVAICFSLIQIRF
ncbi:MAG: hypothetical protein HXX09_16650 [Bacteroidetes bacterium]|nr:hypothetical protein [Bacteroidota bacterium]